MIDILKLSPKFSILKTKYEGPYSIKEFLKYTHLNHLLVIPTNNNSVWIEIESKCFESINNQVMKHIQALSNKTFRNYAKHNWVYTQRKEFNMEWMHQHLLVHPNGRSKIIADYTFTFYLQTTDQVTGDQGCIVFETEDKQRHKYFPEVGDVFVFPSDLRHTAIPTPDSDKERIVFAGSFCMDIENQNYSLKSAL